MLLKPPEYTPTQLKPSPGMSPLQLNESVVIESPVVLFSTIASVSNASTPFCSWIV